MQEEIIAADALKDKTDTIQQANTWNVIRQYPRLHTMQLQFIENHFQHLRQCLRCVTPVVNLARKLVPDLTGV